MVSDPGSTVEADGIGMRGPDKIAFPALHREYYLAVGGGKRSSQRFGNKGHASEAGFAKIPPFFACCAPVRPHESKNVAAVAPVLVKLARATPG